MSKHTPGDWETIPPRRKGKHWRVGARFGVNGEARLYLVAVIENGAPGDTLETEKANAHLFAAGPMMLAALNEAVGALKLAAAEICRHSDHDVSVMAAVELAYRQGFSAIAKAKPSDNPVSN